MFNKKALALIGYFLVGLSFYFGYSTLVYKPAEINHFSLIDDGQQLENTEKLNKCFFKINCTDATSVIFETQFGRLRPVYWLIQWLNTNLFSLNPARHHEARIYFYGGLIALGWLFLSARVNVNKIIGIFGLVCLIMSSTFTENIIRLGPTEPYMLLVLIGVAIMYLKKRSSPSISAAIFLATLIKETGFVNYLPILIVDKPAINFSKKPVLFGLIVTLVILFGYKNLAIVKSSSTKYSTNYNLSWKTMTTNAVSFLQVIYLQNRWFFILGTTSTVFLFYKKQIQNSHLLKWLGLMVLLNFVILIPWSFVLERYVLPILFFLYLFIVIAMSSIWREVYKYYGENILIGALVMTFIVTNVLSEDLLNSLAKSINYQNWYTTYTRYEYDYVSYLAKLSNKTIYIWADDILDNWEVSYEIPIHLEYLYSERRNLSNEVEQTKSGDIVLNNSSLYTIKKFNEKDFILKANKSYDLKIIDTDKFVEEIRAKPSRLWEQSWNYQTKSIWWWKIWTR